MICYLFNNSLLTFCIVDDTTHDPRPTRLSVQVTKIEEVSVAKRPHLFGVTYKNDSKGNVLTLFVQTTGALGVSYFNTF